MLSEWQAFGLLAAAGSTLFYLLSRKGKQMEIPLPAVLTASFVMSALLAVVLAVANHVPLALPQTVPWGPFLMIAAIVCSLAGNFSEMRGVFHAPNPGYALAIVKSNAAIVLPFSVVLLGSEWSIPKAIGAGAVLVAQAVLIYQSRKDEVGKDPQARWLVYSAVAFLALAGLTMLNKYVVNQGMDRLVFLAYVVIPAGIVFAVWWIKTGWKPNLYQAFLLIATGACSALMNFGLYTGVPIAPNPGYVSAINAASIGTVTLISMAYGERSLIKMAMVLQIMLGLMLVVM
jgi:uncharacterized membrane protein